MSDRGSEIIGRSYRQAGPAIRRGRYRPRGAPRVERALAWRNLVGVLEATPDVVAVVTRQGATLYLNQAGRDLLGLSADADLATVRVLDAFSPEARRTLRAALRAAIRHGYWRGRASLLSALCEEVPVSQVIIAHRGPDRRIDFFSIIARDLREQRRIEQEREHLLQREQEARARAEAAVRLRDEVLAMVAHDLRNPVGAILSGASALAQDPDDEARRAVYLGALRHAAEAMDSLIQDLLDVARSETGGLALERKALAPGSLIRHAMEVFRPQAAERGLSLQSAIGGDLPTIQADRARLLQALGNLVTNAMKFTPPGGRILVRACREGAGVRLSVIDDGPGIKREHLAHVFDRFWQARANGRAGAGLGLAIARAIVLAHGGEIWVESAPGRGAAFHIRLPGPGVAAAAIAVPKGASGTED